MKKSGIILAGGKSSRMGENKAECMLNGKTLVEHISDVFFQFKVDEIILNTNSDIQMNPNWKICKDIYPDLGPLGGIYSSLVQSSTEINIFVETELLLKLGEKNNKHWITFVGFKQKFFPLIAVIKKEAEKLIKNQLLSNQLKVQDLMAFPECNTLIVEDEEWSSSFNPEKCLFNINTKTDLEYCKSIY